MLQLKFSKVHGFFGVFVICFTIISLLLASPIEAVSSGSTLVRVDLGWTLQGPHAPFFIAVERGYFAEEGISVKIEPGTGAPDQIKKMAVGLFDAGLLDLATLTEFKAREDVPIIAVYGVYNKPGIATIALKRYGITEPRDLEGKKVGAPPPDIGARLFPAFAAATGIDMKQITFEPVTFALREPSLVEGKVHAITGLLHSVLGVKQMGVPEDDIVIFDYKEYGVDVYGAGIVFTERFVQENPAAVSGFLRAITQGYADMISNPEYALSVMMKREPLLNPDLEKARIELVISYMIDTPEVREHGFGYYDEAILEAHIKTITNLFDLPRTLSVSELFTDEFFPPLEERLIFE